METALTNVDENLPIDMEVISMLPVDAETDIREARRTYKNLIEVGNKGIETALRVVEDSEHPRAIEVFSTLISTMANVNQKLVELHKTTKELTDGIAPVVHEENTQVNNNMYIGSPKELLEMMNNAEE